MSHDKGVSFVAYSPRGTHFATGGTDGSVVIWNALGSEIARFASHQGQVAHLAFSEDGRFLASASSDRTLKLFDVKSGKELRTLTGHDEAIHGVGFSPDGRRIVSASSDQTLRFWDTNSGANVMTLAYDTPVWGAKFLPDGKRLAVIPMDDTVQILESR
ncbi:MAG: PD40 domain-containing protein [Acidobacteria bacterium]|nr:PD40 domain-containing protein [Acidobacteriota bacterium]